MAPLLLLIRQRTALAEFRAQIARDPRRAAVLLASLVAVCVASFWQSSLPLLILPMLPLVAAAFTVGRLGAALALLVLAGIGGVFTLEGHGPVALAAGTAGTKARLFQFYLAVAVMMVLPAAAELRRRDAIFLRLQESEAGMRLLTDHLGDAILHTDVEGVVRYASPAPERLSGLAPSDIVGQRHESFIVVEDHASVGLARAAGCPIPSAR